MPATYQYRCALGHITEVVRPMTEDCPGTIRCEHAVVRLDPAEREFPGRTAYEVQTELDLCGADARRVYSAPAAIHFKAGGFYSTDVKARQERRRRPNPGDDLYVGHDEAARRIARSL